MCFDQPSLSLAKSRSLVFSAALPLMLNCSARFHTNNANCDSED
jgi:hypothetical protein